MPESVTSIFPWFIAFFFLALVVGLIYPPLILFWTQNRTRAKAASFCVFGMLISFALTFFTNNTDPEYSIFDRVVSLSFVFGIIGLIAPSLVIPVDIYQNRKVSSLVYFSISFISAICLILVDTEWHNHELNNNTNTASSALNSNPSPVSKEEENLNKMIPLIVSGWAETNLPRLRMFNITHGIDGGYNIYIEINAKEDSGWKLWHSSLEREMSEIYLELYTSGYDIGRIKIAGYTALDDVNGFRHEVPIWITEMDRKTASKINWNADENDLQQTILPGRWTTTFAFPPIQRLINE